MEKRFSVIRLWERLNKSTFCGEPAQLYAAGIGKIKRLVSLSLPQKFLGLFNQRFHSRFSTNSA
jgi:hypothetical protein